MGHSEVRNLGVDHSYMWVTTGAVDELNSVAAQNIVSSSEHLVNEQICAHSKGFDWSHEFFRNEELLPVAKELTLDGKFDVCTPTSKYCPMEPLFSDANELIEN